MANYYSIDLDKVIDQGQTIFDASKPVIKFSGTFDQIHIPYCNHLFTHCCDCQHTQAHSFFSMNMSEFLAHGPGFSALAQSGGSWF
jgi:hypothetical protein